MRIIKKGNRKKNKSIGVLKSDANRPKDKPLIGPKPLDKKRVEELKSEIARLEEAFNREQRVQTARGSSSFTQNMYNISKEAEKRNKELIKLTGKGSSWYEFKRKK